MNDYAVPTALDKILQCKAERFIKNSDYLKHVQNCLDEISIQDPKIAFIFGGIDAMMQDMGSALQMTRPPKTEWDISCRENRLARLKKWEKELISGLPDQVGQ
ncbi:MAG: hypothetical protein U9N44_08460 [Chloroflexota bacterium]|nr:hypothetical protein [Chloroflexota bacterium]